MINFPKLSIPFKKKAFDPLKSEIMQGNIGHWFNRTFLRHYIEEGINISDEKKLATWVKSKTNEVLNANYKRYEDIDCKMPEDGEYPDTKGIISIGFDTIYPGLVCGIGYEHMIGFVGEFKLGFSFDHTTGLPYIPGSSVKGLLRSAFHHPGYLTEIIEDWLNGPNETVLEDNKLTKDSIHDINWRVLEKSIFEGMNSSGDPVKNKYDKDIFFDAFIKTTNEKNKGKFLADDYITSHQNKKDKSLSPFTEPNPVRFIKVCSGVRFHFQFFLHDTFLTEDLKFTAEMKEKLFRQILLDFGIGAKTNVGYGQFTYAVDTDGEHL